MKKSMEQACDTPAARQAAALRAVIEKCKDMMRAAKQRGDMEGYRSYLNQMYAAKRQLRNVARAVGEKGA